MLFKIQNSKSQNSSQNTSLQERTKLEAWREEVRAKYEEVGASNEVPPDCPRPLQVIINNGGGTPPAPAPRLARLSEPDKLSGQQARPVRPSPAGSSEHGCRGWQGLQHRPAWRSAAGAPCSLAIVAARGCSRGTCITLHSHSGRRCQWVAAAACRLSRCPPSLETPGEADFCNTLDTTNMLETWNVCLTGCLIHWWMPSPPGCLS